MIKHRAEFKFTLLLAVFAVFLGCDTANRVFLKSKKAVEEMLPGAGKKTDYTRDLDLAKSILRPKPVDISLKKDPFRPLAAKLGFSQGAVLSESPDLVLTGILASEEEPLALISGLKQSFCCAENDSVGDWTVKSIEKDRVILEKKGKSITLKLE